MYQEVGGTEYNLPDEEAYLNRYLNTTYYNSLDDSVKAVIEEHLFNIGGLDRTEGQTLETDMQLEQAYKWKGKVGLINVTDYVKASTNTNCTSVYNVSASGCKSTASTTNWMYTSTKKYGENYSGYYIWWAMSFLAAGNYRGTMWIVVSSGGSGYSGAHNSDGVLPVLYLSSDIQLTGTGQSSDMYQIVS